ncbi:MAG TPA: hypothetical protein VFF49_04865 [Thermodesulfobacteriota bacterium]|nr:hypothetical protein [Thermodesulfobacteriota bacterium]
MNFSDLVMLQNMSNGGQTPPQNSADILGLMQLSQSDTSFPMSGGDLIKLQQKPNIKKSIKQPTTPQNPLAGLELLGLQQQREGIQNLEGQLDVKKEINPWVAAVSAASDIMWGTGYTGELLKQQAMQEKERKTSAKEIQEAREKLSKTEIDILKEQQKEKKSAEQFRMLAGKQEKTASDKEQKLESTLFGDWQKNPTTQASQEVATAYEKVKLAATQPSGAGDMSLIFGYMKMLDPKSVVREGEFETAKKTAAIPDRVWNIYQQLSTGEKLTQEQRTEFTKQAEKVFSGQLEQQKRWDTVIKQRAKNLGLDPSRVVLGETLFGSSYSRTENKQPEIKEWQGKKYKIQGNKWVEVK